MMAFQPPGAWAAAPSRFVLPIPGADGRRSRRRLNRERTAVVLASAAFWAPTLITRSGWVLLLTFLGWGAVVSAIGAVVWKINHPEGDDD